MSNSFQTLRLIPLYIGIAYLGLTIVLFFGGPFDWPIENTTTLLLFLSASIAGISVGFCLGARSSSPGSPLRAWRFCFRLGAIASVALLFPSSVAYTGKWPWEIGLVLSDQGAAYKEMAAALQANESGIRLYVSLMRAVFGPLVFCVVPFAILNWRDLRRADLLLLFLHVISIVVFSLMRGTDRETVDLLFVVVGTTIIRFARQNLGSRRLHFGVTRIFAFTLFPAALSIIALALFIDRKESRMGGNDAFCVGETVVCSIRNQSQAPFVSKAMFGVEMLTAYTAQGYYGLSLALDSDFSWTYGLGHSPFLMDRLGNYIDDSLYDRSYMAKINAAGWDDKAQWSTIFPWLASDVGFPVVPFVMAVFGFVWGASWKSSVVSRSDAGALVFLYSCILVLYIPANNQLAQTLEPYFSAVFWFFTWLASGRFSAIRLRRTFHQYGN